MARVRRRGPLRLAFVGNLISPRKSLRGLLAALAAVRNELWELSVVGSFRIDPDYAARIRRNIAAFGLEEKVRLLGPLPDTELGSLLKQSDIIAMPLSYEGSGIICLEGMAHGLPVLACRSGGAGEIVTHGEKGYLLEPGDVGEIASLLRRLIKDRDELLRLSLGARQRFAEFPTWKQSTAKVREFLLEMEGSY